MELFSNEEEQKLIHKFWDIHDEIFSIPAKRYLFCTIDLILGGTTGPAYDGLGWDKIQNAWFVNYSSLHNFDFQRGDKLIVTRPICDINVTNNIWIESYNRTSEDVPFEHILVIAQVNFLYYRQYAQLLRESLENFHKPFVSTKLRAFELNRTSVRKEK